MKNIVLLMLATYSFFSFAQSGSVQIGGVRIVIQGKGGHVCSAKAMLSDRPVLARGATKAEAEGLAVQVCKSSTPNHAFFCKVDRCEKDNLNANNLNIEFEVNTNGSQIGISYKGKSGFQCQKEAWHKVYTAKAATRVEAMVLASNECATGNSGSAFFCDLKNSDCVAISPSTNVDIQVGHQNGSRQSVNILLDIFRKPSNSLNCEAINQ
jgi:hypothetical protein